MATGMEGWQTRGRCLPSLMVALAFCGCTTVKGTMATVPPEWRKANPWGPEALALRERGELKPCFYTPQMAADAQWARENLEDGDILFRYSASCRPLERLLNRVVMKLSDCCFTHSAVAFHHGGDVWLYDTTEPEGLRKIPYEFWALDVAPGTFAVKRLHPEYRHCVPQALAYCEAQWLRQPPFDNNLHLDDAELYCSELVEKAYRTAGLVLSDPAPIRCLPHYRRFSFLKPFTDAFTEVRVDEPVFSIGNPCYGTFGSPCLELVFGGEKRKGDKPPQGPTCPPTPFPSGAVAPVVPVPPAAAADH